jgi:hypothetical protein
VVGGDVDEVGAGVADIVVDVVDVSGTTVGSVVSDVVGPWSASGAAVPAQAARTVTRAAMRHTTIEDRPESRMCRGYRSAPPTRGGAGRCQNGALDEER